MDVKDISNLQTEYLIKFKLALIENSNNLKLVKRILTTISVLLTEN